MEVVSTLCFGGQSAPEPDLIKMLMEIVFSFDEQSEVLSTQDLTPLDVKKDAVPVVRSSLLQLLLEHKYTVYKYFVDIYSILHLMCSSCNVKKHLEEYFDHSRKALTGDIDENLCLLCIQCFEVMFFYFTILF